MFGKLLSGDDKAVDWSQVGGGVISAPTAKLHLALDTLSRFDLSNIRSHLLPFVASPNSGVLRLLDKHPESEIRRKAELTCAKVLVMVAVSSEEDDGCNVATDNGHFPIPPTLQPPHELSNLDSAV